MLTISTIKNSNAAKYYAKEDSYYLAEVDAKESSLWWGSGAIELGLKGKVEEKELQNLLVGRLPNGITIGLQKDGTINHRPGYDLCFQAPKSVSILALDGEDKRFYSAHFDAVRETLKVIERDCAQAKIFKDGKIRFENGKNLTVALVRHTTSRELDLHLHHHALVMNVTKRSDNVWRALASSKTSKIREIKSNEINGFFERIYHNQIYYGLIYKTALAKKVRELGCELEIVGKHGLWEIKGVSKEARDIMSKRRTQIEEKLNKLNHPSLKAADIVALNTREKKPKNINLAEIKQTWREELSSVGFSSKEFIAELDSNKDKNKEAANKIISAQEAVRGAIEQLSRYKLKLDYTKIAAEALEFSIGENTNDEIVAALNNCIKDGTLIPLNNSNSQFVTKELIETEKAIMDIVARSKDTNVKILLKDTTINDIEDGETKNLALNILHSKSRISLVEGQMNHGEDDESIKFIDTVFKLAESAGKTVRVLSPNRIMANDINESIRRRPNNLWQWLVSLGKPEVGDSVAGFKHKYKEEVDLPLLRFRQGKDIIIVNNAQTLGCSDTHSLLELTEKSKAKLIFLRDIKARQGFSAGNPIETLKQAGIETFNLSKEEKSIDYAPQLKAIESNSERTKQLAATYASKEDYERDNTTVFVGSKGRLKLTNESIREELKKLGKLSNAEHTISVLNPHYLSKTEAILAHKYPKNAVIRFYDSRSEDWNIESINKKNNTIRLTQNGLGMSWNPKKQKEQETDYAIFKRESLQLAAGDRLIATGNMNNLDIKNATRFVVQDINEKHIKLLSSSKILKINLSELKDSHFQYDYATTLNKYSKKQLDHVLVDMKAYALDKPTINELTKYAKKSLTIFTNDADVAQKRFERVSVKLTATELLKSSSISTNKISNNAFEKKIDSIKISNNINSSIKSNHADYSGFLDAKEINRLLNNSAESFVERLLGRPNEKLSSITEWRYGSKGSLVICMHGDKRGLWYNFETGGSGNLLSLIQKETGLPFKESIKYVVDLFNGGLYVNSAKLQRQKIKTQTHDKQIYNKEGKISKYAQKLATESQSIVGTVVETYLKETRGINSTDTLDIRYHPKVYVGNNTDKEPKYLPVMLAIGRDKDGDIQCVQATYIDPKTNNKADLDVKKRTYVSPSGSLVSLQNQEHKNRILNNELSFIAEGVETGLSVRDAAGTTRSSNVAVTLGKSNLMSIDPQSVGQKIVLCLDNDGESSFADKTIHKAAERLINFGKEVFIAIPDQISKGTKTDFNDVAKISGVSEVRKILDSAVTYKEWKDNIEKNNLRQINEMIPSISNKIMQKDKSYYTDSKVYNPLFKNSEINLNIATKLVYSEQKEFPAKHLDHISKNLSMQKNIGTPKNLNVHDTQKVLSKSELEIY